MREWVKRWLQKLREGDVLFIILNTLFWLALGYVLLSDRARLFIGGALIAIALGVGFLYAALFAQPKGALAHQRAADPLQVGFGVVSLSLGMLLVMGFFMTNANTPTQRQRLQQALDWAASGNTALSLRDYGLREIPPAVWEMTHLNMEGVRVSMQMPHYLLFIEFDDGERLVINQERARQFGASSEHLRIVFKEMYGK